MAQGGEQFWKKDAGLVKDITEWKEPSYAPLIHLI